jgi:hypothetical protein
LTPIRNSAKKFSESWWKKKMPVGVVGEKTRRVVKCETQFAEFVDEKASHV